jgi:DNA-binding MarR family transcriptional regulator
MTMRDGTLLNGCVMHPDGRLLKKKSARSLHFMRRYRPSSSFGTPLQYVRTFLEVAMDEGRSVNEYAKRLKVSKSVMSRQLLDIGPRTRNASTGFGLIVTRPNMHERRRHEVYLSPKGRALAQHLKRTLNQED